MKRKIAIGLVLAMLFLSGCSGNEDEKNLVKNSEENVETNVDCFFWEGSEVYGFDTSAPVTETLIIPKECTKVRYATFSDQNNTIKHVVFESDDTVVEDSFNYLVNLESIKLPGNMKELVGNSFLGCAKLTSIALPNSIETIGDHAFSNCTGLTQINLGTELKSIEDAAFFNCQNLQDVTLQHVESIGNDAFFSCDSLKTIKLPEGLRSIGKTSFADCDKLESIYLPESLENIDGTALAQTHTVTVYVKKDSYADKEFDTGYGTAGGLVKKYY